jgi:hypothetical protein
MLNIGTGATIRAGVNLGNTASPLPTVITDGLALYLDAATYPGSGSTWTDTIGSREFSLYNNPAYSSNNGGYFTFTASLGNWASCSSSLPNLSTWTVEVWHYYTGQNLGGYPCIITEPFPGSASRINYTLGTTTENYTDNTDLKAAYFDGTHWQQTANSPLTPNNWYQITGTFDGTNINMYKQGAVVNTVAVPGSPLSSGGGINLMRRWDADQLWDGRLSVVRIYNRALSNVEIAQNYAAERSRYGL